MIPSIGLNRDGAGNAESCDLFGVVFFIALYLNILGVGSGREGSWCVRHCLYLLPLPSGRLVLVGFSMSEMWGV